MEPESILEARSKARTASVLGTVSVVLCLAAPCGSCMPLFAALPCGLLAIDFSRKAMDDTDDPLTLALGRNGMTLGLISLSYSLIALTLVALYVLLYVGMIAFLVAFA